MGTVCLENANIMKIVVALVLLGLAYTSNAGMAGGISEMTPDEISKSTELLAGLDKGVELMNVNGAHKYRLVSESIISASQQVFRYVIPCYSKHCTKHMRKY